MHACTHARMHARMHACMHARTRTHTHTQVVQYRLVGDGVVKARVRLLGYLNPQSPQFFDARQQAVTISDYSLELVNSNMAQAPALGETGRGGGGSEGGEGVDEEDEEEEEE